jgi:hypothetical protein
MGLSDECPRRHSPKDRRNEHLHRGKQSHQCHNWARQFVRTLRQRVSRLGRALLSFANQHHSYATSASPALQHNLDLATRLPLAPNFLTSALAHRLNLLAAPQFCGRAPVGVVPPGGSCR